MVTAPTVIMALDLSPGCTGVAIASTDWDGAVGRVRSFSVTSEKIKRTEGEAAWVSRLEYGASIIALEATTHGVTHAFIEGYAWSMRGSQRLGEQGYAVKRELVHAGVRITNVGMGSARKTLTGKGTSNKGKCHQVLHAYGFRPENLDESDALVILNHAMSELGAYCLIG